MQSIAKTPELRSTLQSFDTFRDIAPAALDWLIERSEYKLYDIGELLFYPGLPVEHMQIIMRGRYVVRLEQKGEARELGVWESGYITGVLPFSRMKEARAKGQALEPTYTLELHKDYFVEMVNVSYELTQALVAAMSDRVRDFTTMQFQNEKLMALGRMSASLAHELNNPASAMVRNAEELYKRIHATPEKFKAIISMRITPEQTDQVNAILFDKINNPQSTPLSLMQREACKDDILDWLEERNIMDAEDIAETFADYGLAEDDLDQIDAIVGGNSLPALMWWLESTLSLEGLVGEIQEASSRISQLVQSIKDYSHMDRGVAMESFNVHDGIHSTLTMLKHKLRGKNVELVLELEETLPKINGFPGELNQVWTNLFANAIDALPPGGQLAVRTYTDRGLACIDVIDNGHGIPDEIKNRIFEPFFTTKSMGEGTGMGLDIVKKIVDRHKGQISVASRPGRTAFTLCLPPCK
jgi:signal transduction histidine kinase